MHFMTLTSDRIGLRFRLRREQAGLTREKLAARADVSVSTVARLENNDALPSTATLIRLSSVVGVTAGELIDGVGTTDGGQAGEADSPGEAARGRNGTSVTAEGASS
ncbi:helix-turn-helix domain-containing protein [Microbacterium sp.]|jgi:transcriptional regulator with XRE-family HTH domain|uniref:helix-turn-helix domain-containing protein n=1 Tax=Microbacterium sp. TaxID=51671 RepID=UPI0037CAFA54